MAVIIKGGTSGLNADVTQNKELSICPTLTESNSGFISVAGMSDKGDVIADGERTVRAIDSSFDYRLRVGMDTLMFEDTFAGTTINTSMWDTPSATATVAMAGGFMTLNSAGSVTSGQGCILRSKRHFPVYTTFPVSIEFLFSLSSLSFNNALCEIGFGLIGTAPAAAAVDGTLFRMNSAGISFVLTNNLNEVTETFLPYTDLTANGIDLTKTCHGIIVFGEDNVEFWLDDLLMARIKRSAAAANMTAAMQGHVFARVYNTGTNTLTPLKLQISKTSVNIYDMNNPKPWSHILAGFGQFCQQGASNMPVGRTQINVANPHLQLAAQMTAPSATALGTGGTAGLGGIQRIGNGANPLALTENVAYITHSYQVPAANIVNPVTPTKNFYITGVKYNLVTRGATAPATIGTFSIELNFGSTAVSPATAENATLATKTARSTVLGVLSIPASAEIGTKASGEISQYFDTPVVVNPGEFVQLTLRPLVGYTISAAQELLCIANFIGYWE